MIELLIAEDNERLRTGLVRGLEGTGAVQVVYDGATGEDALEAALAQPPDAALLDVQLEGSISGIDLAVALRRTYPRLPVVFYSINDDDAYFRAFRQAGILSHYAYVRKSNYLLPDMILPLITDAINGRNFIDPEIEARVQEVRQRDADDPMALLEPNEQRVARMLAQGMSNEQIAMQLGFRDRRTVSRTNGQIYTVWGLNETTDDEKIARARAAIIVRERRLIHWDEQGVPHVLNARGDWVPTTLPEA